MTTMDIAEQKTYDLIVVGGGITGAGVARDAALRGLKVLLLEKRDYASGVSSKTTRLVHGGLRYLANFELDLVAEALRERAILRRQASHLITPMPIMIPIYQGDPHGRTAVSIGIHIYELLSRERDIPHYFTAGVPRTLSMEPHLNQDGLKGCALFYDHQIALPERLVIENIISARNAGAAVLNYTALEKFQEASDDVVVSVRNTLTGERGMVRAKVLVNAGGPWVDHVRRSGEIDRRQIINPTKGVHLVLPRLCNQALFVASRDGRMFFIIPLDKWSLIGTTDTKYDGDLDEVHADAADVDYLLAESKRILPGLPLTREQIFYTYAGVRPLAFAGEKEGSISRKHRVINEGRYGRIITIAGGKYTTYRKMAEDTVDAVCKLLSVRARCSTAKAPLPGTLSIDFEEYISEVGQMFADRYGLKIETVRHLVRIYGVRAERVLDIARENHLLRERIAPESQDIFAQVVFGIIEEEAKTLTDMVFRRLHLGITSTRGEGQIERIADIAASEMSWNADERLARIEEYKDELRKEKRF